MPTPKVSEEDLTFLRQTYDSGPERNILDAYLALTAKKPPKPPKADPAAKEALRLAKAKVKDQLRVKGFDPTTLPAERLTSLATALVAKDPYFMAEAAARLLAAAEASPLGILSTVESPSP